MQYASVFQNRPPSSIYDFNQEEGCFIDVEDERPVEKTVTERVEGDDTLQMAAVGDENACKWLTLRVWHSLVNGQNGKIKIKDKLARIVESSGILHGSNDKQPGVNYIIYLSRIVL